jgi:hypothetical protein
LKINTAKSTFHHEGLSDLELDPFKSLYPYIFSELAIGFKYLGVFIKTGTHRLEDWLWLIRKMEKKIDNWCYRWLSLGGRLILLKVVLESQSVYWLSLAIIPNSILNTLRKIMMNFLWNGNRETNHIHLCKWEQISVPKRNGGWGLRNLLDFKQAMAANSLWRVLTSPSIWHRVIKDKYLSHLSVINWLRSFTFQAWSSSCIWGGLLKSIHLILQWLSWNPGKGQLIELGRDKILDLGEKYFLSDILISDLHERHIYSLAQAQRTDDRSYSSFLWVKSYEIGLTGTSATEWDRFRLDLIDAGTFLQDREDSLLWTGGGG